MSGATHRRMAVPAIVALEVIAAETNADIVFSGSLTAWLGRLMALSLMLISGILGTSCPDLDLRYLRRFPWLGRVLKHRRQSHSLLGSLIIGGPLAVGLTVLGLPWCGIAFVVGWLSHIMADGLTPAGVSILWPYSRRLRLFPRHWCFPEPSSERFARLIAYLSVLLILALSWCFDGGFLTLRVMAINEWLAGMVGMS